MFNYRQLLFFCLLFVFLPGLTLLFSNTAYVQTTSGFIYPAEPPGAVPQPANPAAVPDVSPYSAAASANAFPSADQPFLIKPAVRNASPRLITASAQEDELCYQLLVNPQLDVLEVEGFNVAEPWVPLDHYVYIASDTYVSPNHSLYLWDADVNNPPDPSAGLDSFAQAFFMPTDLTSVTINYYRATGNTNATDKAFGNFWTIDEQGFLDEFQGSWTVTESHSVWREETISITDPTLLAPLEDEQIAILLFSETNGLLPGEVVWFDDITVTACTAVDPGISTLYVPSVLRIESTKPICIPPSENPADTRTQNRGTVQTSALCQSTLSSVDTRDYYTFSPSQAGSHTFHLRKMPSWSNWSLLLFVDVDPPIAAPGPTGGECRIGTPGPQDKSVTCSLQAGQKYFILVAAGDDYSDPLGSYEMQVTRP